MPGSVEWGCVGGRLYVRIMASSVTQHLDPFGSALRTARDALARVSEQPTWSIPDAELPGLIQAAQQLAAAAGEVGCRLVAEAHTRNLADQHGASSTAAWLDQLTGCGRGEAGQVTRTARRLAGRYQLVRVALAAGRISLAKAHVIRVALDRLPADLSEQTLQQAQASMLEHAQMLDPKALARVGMRIWEVIDPDGADAHEQRLLERQEAKANRSAWITSRTDDGVTRFWIRTPELVGETFLTILEGYAAPRRTDAHGPDTRPYPQRLGDAFTEWLSRQNPDHLPDHGGLPATLLITTSADGQPNPDRTGEPATDHPQGSTATAGGPGTGAGTTASGQRVSGRTVSWLACTALLVPVLLDDGGIPLRLGRSRRLFTPGQRLGFAVRDKGCVFPGCDRPPSWCEAHHIGSWADGGPTDLTNGCLLCGYHHRLIHHGDWQVVMGGDGHPQVIPPDWTDPLRTPVSNTYWHPDWQPKPRP
jgi:hypothetical protein